jgi:5-methylcytosine-specific restriction endonuclease McrBC regulatory subunit McrC
MEKVKSLRQLTENEFNTLKEANMLLTIYPDAPGTYQELKGTRPKPKKIPDFESLIKACEHYLNNIEKGKQRDDDQHYIYEAAMECIYGKEVWDFINLNSK